MSALSFHIHCRLVGGREVDGRIDEDLKLEIRVESPSGQVTETRPLHQTQLAQWLQAARLLIPDDRTVWRGQADDRFASAVEEARDQIETKLAQGNASPGQNDLGRQLFELVFAGQVEALYRDSRGRAAEAGGRLVVHCHFDLEDPVQARLATLPWEQLYDSKRRDHLALDDLTPISRFLRYSGVTRKVRVPQVLRILAVTSTPDNWQALDVTQSLHQQAFPQANVVVERLVDPDREALRRAIRRGPHVLHFDGHGAVDPVTGVGSLMLVDRETRNAEAITGPELATWLLSQPGLRLVVLNSCLGAASGGRTAFADVGTALVRAGVPAVVAMRRIISDRDAGVFAESLYSGLATGRSLEASLSMARRDIHGTGSDEWSTPVLFSHTNEAFSIPADVKPALTRAFSWLGAVTAAIAVNLVLQSQGGPPLVPGIEFSSVYPQSIPVIGGPLVGLLLLGLLGVVLRYQRESSARGLYFRLPIAFDMPIGTNRTIAKLYQSLIFIAFLVVPLYAVGYSVSEMTRSPSWELEGYATFAGCEGRELKKSAYDRCRVEHWTTFMSPAVFFKGDTYRFGPGRVKKTKEPEVCASYPVCSVTFFPFWQPWVLLWLCVLCVVLFVVAVRGIWVEDALRWTNWVFLRRSWAVGAVIAVGVMALSAAYGSLS